VRCFTRSSEWAGRVVARTDQSSGEVRQTTVEDKHASVENTARPKADLGDSSQVGAPMAGVVIEGKAVCGAGAGQADGAVRVKDGGAVKKGDILCVLSAMSE
jgi:pyruvate carboxylase